MQHRDLTALTNPFGASHIQPVVELNISLNLVAMATLKTQHTNNLAAPQSMIDSYSSEVGLVKQQSIPSATLPIR